MITHKYTEQELRFTAVIYATRDEIVEHIRTKGKLPAKAITGGFPTAINHIARNRGTDVALSEKEKLVYDAIVNDKRLPAGGVILFQDSGPIYSLETGQEIEICPPPRSLDWE